MIWSQRKRHLRTWLAFAIVIPIGLIAAVLAIPSWPREKQVQPPEIVALPNIVSTIERPDYTINLRTGNDSRLQLELINRQTLTIPSAFVYFVLSSQKNISDGKDLKEAEFVGRIEAKGTYRFPLRRELAPSKDSLQLIVFDFIHDKIIETIKF